MLKLYIPSSKYQIKQFKLYTNSFIEELKREQEDIYISIRRDAMKLPSTFGMEDEQPIDLLIENCEKLNQKAERLNEQYKLNKKHEKMHKVKVTHSIDVAYDSKRVGVDLNLFNEENIKILWTTGLLHDIGRFMQLRHTGTFKDIESFDDINFKNISDHGQLGEQILTRDKRIQFFYPFSRIYDEFIGKVVGNHYESRITNYPININDNTFNNYSLNEIIKDKNNGRQSANDEYEKLISWYVKIIQDVDRLDILKQVERGDFTPQLSNEKKDDVAPAIYDLFYNGKYINMNHLKKQGLWTCNAGQLLRWSFIYQLTLVSTIKNIKNLNLIEKIWEREPIENLKSGYDFIMALMDSLIETSPDGVYVDKEKALKKVKKV